jgi:hypothetical protein
MLTSRVGGTILWTAVTVLLVSVLLACLAGCDTPVEIGPDGPDPRIQPDCPDSQCPYLDQPGADVPPEYRSGNYGGSCNHASIQTVLRYLGYHDLAAEWRRNYGGGASAQDLARICDRYGLQYAATFNGDEAFLAWCSRTGRPAAIHYYQRHAVTFAGYTLTGKAILIDNNWPSKRIEVPKADFVQRWKEYGGCAITVLGGKRPPPRPWLCPRPNPNAHTSV